MCEHGDRRLSVLTKDGGKMTLVDRFEGKRLNSPNDGVLKSNGDIYFTDPPYGCQSVTTIRVANWIIAASIDCLSTAK